MSITPGTTVDTQHGPGIVLHTRPSGTVVTAAFDPDRGTRVFDIAHPTPTDDPLPDGLAHGVAHICLYDSDKYPLADVTHDDWDATLATLTALTTHDDAHSVVGGVEDLPEQGADEVVRLLAQHHPRRLAGWLTGNGGSRMLPAGTDPAEVGNPLVTVAVVLDTAVNTAIDQLVDMDHPSAGTVALPTLPDELAGAAATLPDDRWVDLIDLGVEHRRRNRDDDRTAALLHAVLRTAAAHAPLDVLDRILTASDLLGPDHRDALVRAVAQQRADDPDLDAFLVNHALQDGQTQR